MKLNLSLAQMNLQLGNTDYNLGRALQMISEAANNGSQMILFPELWSSGYDLQKREKYSVVNLEILDQLKREAKEKQIAVGGSILLKKGNGFVNHFFIISENGAQIAGYDKVHLFRLMNEEKWLLPGSRLETAALNCGKAGLAVCYDLRFPELFRGYAFGGVNLILLVAQWPKERISHWKILIRARAIENQLFFAAVNCAGLVGKMMYGGCSAVISPWGETLIEGKEEEEQLLATEIDFDQVEEVRKTIPVFSDRRIEIYQ
jgi:omega-amidase